MRAWLGLEVSLVACTASGPRREDVPVRAAVEVVAPAPEQAPLATEHGLPAGGALLVRGAPTMTRFGLLRGLQPLGGARALLAYAGDNASTLALSTGPMGYAWSVEVPTDVRLDPEVGAVVDDVIVMSVGRHHDGAVGFDLGSGALRWRNMPVAPEEVWKGQRVRRVAGDGQVLFLLREPRGLRGYAEAQGTIAYRARDGGIVGAAAEGPDAAAVSPRWVAHRGREVSDDPDQPEWVYTLRAREALSAGDVLGPLADVCIVEDRLYASGTRGLERRALAQPGGSWQRILGTVPDLARHERCDRHGDEDLLWLPGMLIGVGIADGATWTLELGGRVIDGWGKDALGEQALAGAALPDHVARLVWVDGRQELLQVDLRGRRARAVRLGSTWSGHDVRDPRRSVVLLTADDTGVLVSIDGASGRVGAAVRIGGEFRGLRLVSAGDGFVWVYAQDWGEEAPDRRHPEWRMRLDADTLRPVDPAPAFTLYDVTSWAQAWLDTASAVVSSDAAPGAPPLRPRPPARRSKHPEPAWDLAPLFAAAREAADLPGAAGSARLLAWDRQEEEDGGWAEHALVSLERRDEDGQRRWTIALMRRGDRAASMPWSDGFEPVTRKLDPKDVNVWRPLYGDRRGPRILRLKRRPTAADMRRFLAGSAPWDAQGSWLSETMHYADGREVPRSRAWIVDGNVIDGAWRALTGGAPGWGYPSEVERPL